MEEYRDPSQLPVNPRRRKRTKAQIFKEAYLPVVIAGIAAILILVFIIGSITRAVQKNQAEEAASIAASIEAEEAAAAMALKEQALLKEAAVLAATYDYEGAIAVLDRFPGDMSQYPTIAGRRDDYTAAMEALVVWDDPSKVVNLSFQLLIADVDRAVDHAVYSYSFNKNFVTTGEFSQILQQLYENDYILVSMDDIITEENGIYNAKPLRLPAGKKPLMLTQTNVNYNIYLIDSDGDKLPDKNGGGFASKMVLDSAGNITCEMVDRNGQTVTGAFDMVPILENFLLDHPDFSYRGARAVLALTGYNGLFGYRTNAEALEEFGQAAYDEAVAGAKQIAEKLRTLGYDFACYTYENIPYGTSSVQQIKADLSGWRSEVVPILGTTDMLVYAQLTDIADDMRYSGDKYNLLHENGFRYYLGFCNQTHPWVYIQDSYVRQGRLLVTGASLAHHADWFNGMFDAASILDPARGDVPA